MIYLAIIAWDVNNRLAKYQPYDTEAEARKHVARVKDRFPDAFFAPHPGGGPSDWLIDPTAKTLSVVPLPPAPVILTPLTAEELTSLLVAKNRITRAEIDAIKENR